MPRHFLTITDLTVTELRSLLRRAGELKRRPTAVRKVLAGRTVALVFQKPSMRTRVAFEVAVIRLGGSPIYLGQDDIQLGQREPVKDVARVLSRYVDGVVVRMFGHADVEEFARHASCPVINGLSDAVHPCQALADLFTMEEAFGRVKGLKVAYVGDGNNVLHSLVQGCAMLGASLIAATPRSYRPTATIWAAATRTAARYGGAVEWTADPHEAAQGADILYTDVWTSMGQEQQRAARLKAFRGYQVNRALLAKAAPRCRIMHCLPAHRGEEITDAMMEHPRSLVFEQAENRLHAHAALLECVFRR